MVNMSKVVFVNFLQTLKENTPLKIQLLYIPISNLKCVNYSVLQYDANSLQVRIILFQKGKTQSNFSLKDVELHGHKHSPLGKIDQPHVPILYQSLTPICAESQLQ